MIKMPVVNELWDATGEAADGSEVKYNLKCFGVRFIPEKGVYNVSFVVVSDHMNKGDIVIALIDPTKDKNVYAHFVSSDSSFLVLDKPYHGKGDIHLLALCGPSGSGKSHLERKLTEMFPEDFNKLPQVTTRERRSKDDPYLFCTREHYQTISDQLIGKIGDPNNKYGALYGTFPLMKGSKINTIIVSEEGLMDLSKYVDKNPHVKLLVSYVDFLPGVSVTRDTREEIQDEELKMREYSGDSAYVDLDGSKISRDTESKGLVAEKYKKLFGLI